MKKIFYISLLLLLGACHSETKVAQGTFVEINGSILTKQEVNSALPTDLTSEDSAIFVKEYADRWIKQQLLLQKAKYNVGQQKDIQKLVDEYRNQLLIENYLQLLVERKADILPTEEQVLNFHEEYKNQFILSENIIKGIFVVLPNEAAEKKILMQMLEEDELDKQAIESFCLQNAAKVDFFTDNWVPFNTLKKHLPELNKSDERLLKTKDYIELEDSVFQYIVKVEEYKLVGDNSPLQFIEEEIKEFLLSNNKVVYLQRMEKDLLDEASRKGLIIYNK